MLRLEQSGRQSQTAGQPAKALFFKLLDLRQRVVHARYYLDALDNYAVTGRPYQTLAGGEILDIFNRNTDLVQSGDMTVDQAIENILAEGTPVLEEAARRLQGS